MQNLARANGWSGDRRHHDNLWQVCRSYYQLAKPRIIILLLITTAAAMWVAGHGRVHLGLFLGTLAGGALSAASANAINCLYDRDIDLIMERTRTRPIPSGRIRPRDGLIYAVTLAAIAFGLLATVANLLAALLAMAGIVVYVLVYTHWLKRHSVQNIVIGGAAGAIPPLVGWAAVTGGLSAEAWLLFWIIAIWTPPHFWALALLIRDDYENVGVPMLPVIKGSEETARQIWWYSVALIPLTLMLTYPLAASGVLYLVAALYLGGLFLVKAWLLLKAPDDRDRARSLFKYSIFYLMLLCAAMTVDSLPMVQEINGAIAADWRGILSAVPMLNVS
ncbi:MAG: heme o synthase [Cyanobacteria bacterium]|nr:heme o synthase [Cyanobacteriota bacterium]